MPEGFRPARVLGVEEGRCVRGVMGVAGVENVRVGARGREGDSGAVVAGGVVGEGVEQVVVGEVFGLVVVGVGSVLVACVGCGVGEGGAIGVGVVVAAVVVGGWDRA